MAETIIFKLPNHWLSKKERQFAFEAFLTPTEKTAIQSFCQKTGELLERARVILVDLNKPPGYLGDTIRDSRLAGVLRLAYPQKQVLIDSSQPTIFPQSLLGKKTSPAEVVRVVPQYSGLSLTDFSGKTIDSLVFPQLPLQELQSLQTLWEKIFGLKDLKELPPPAIQLSEADKKAAEKIYQSLKLSPTFNLILHPDAHQNHFATKSWPVKNWQALIEKILEENSKVKIFLSVGGSHPEVSEEISQAFVDRNPNLILLPKLPLPQYIGLLTLFPRQKTLVVGLESAIASHFCPGLKLPSLVIASDEVFNPKIYGPFGGTVVMSSDHRTASVSVETVAKAIKEIAWPEK